MPAPAPVWITAADNCINLHFYNLPRPGMNDRIVAHINPHMPRLMIATCHITSPEEHIRPQRDVCPGGRVKKIRPVCIRAACAGRNPIAGIKAMAHITKAQPFPSVYAHRTQGVIYNRAAVCRLCRYRADTAQANAEY